jgi:hypothetical protein
LGFGLWALLAFWALGFALCALRFGLWALGFALCALRFGLWALGSSFYSRLPFAPEADLGLTASG